MESRKYFKILVVDDDVEYLNLMKKTLEENGYVCDVEDDGFKAIKKLKTNTFNLIITGVKMPKMDGIQLMDKVRKERINIEIIVVTNYASIENAVKCMQRGAFSYFVRTDNFNELLIEIEKVRKIHRLQNENKILKDQQEDNSYIIKTNNSKYKRILNIVGKAANSNVNILITGESGVGKEIIARYIHRLSYRNEGEFVAVNCQALSENLLESELFGHEKGAFTGAFEKRIGRFQQANGGTLFLDEIGEISVGVQTKLLRVLESKSIEMIGSNKSINIDLRLISATNKDLEKSIKRGSFRKDLYYRINTIILDVPPLRERREDLPMLVNFILKKCEKEQKKNIKNIEKEVMEFLLNYNYPGNIRELKNIIERLVVLSENGMITAYDLPETKKNISLEITSSEKITPLKTYKRDLEKNYICKILKLCEGNVTMTAEKLEISSRQLFNKISEYNIDRRNFM